MGIAPAGSVGVEEVARCAVLDRMHARPGERGLGRLLHDAAELTGQGQVRWRHHRQRLDGDDVASDVAHDNAGDRADLVGLLGLAVVVALWPEEFAQLGGFDDDPLRPRGQVPARPAVSLDPARR